MLRRCIAIVILLGDVACTRGNPAFGDGSGGGTADDTSATTRPTSDPSDPSDPSLTSSVDSEETSATSPTDASDDAQDPTTTTDPNPVDTGEPSTGGTMTCEVEKPPLFDVLVFDANLGAIEPVCGESVELAGPVTAGGSPNEMILTVCENDTCDCGEGDTFTLAFVDLAPSPAESIDNGANACVSVRWSRATDKAGCRVEWLTMDTRVAPAEHPIFMASNVPLPNWDNLVPAASLGPSLERCAHDVCPGEQPGFFTMLLGDVGPLVPGDEPTTTMLDPYGNGEVPYDIYAQFAQVHGECAEAFGWAAVLVP